MKTENGNLELAFSDRALARIQPAADRQIFRDQVVRGLILAVHPTGKKVFYLYKKISGKPERILLGEFPAVNVEAARTRALEKSERLSAGELKLAEERLTFGELVRIYIEKHAKPRNRTWQKDEAQIDRYLPHWKALRVS
jgi:Arm DNA-binding domain